MLPDRKKIIDRNSDLTSRRPILTDPTFDNPTENDGFETDKRYNA